MDFYSICPYIRYANILPGIMEGITVRRAYDCRLFYFLEGSANLIVNRTSYFMHPGSVIYLPTGIPYNLVDTIKTVSLNFDLTTKAYGTPPKTPKPPDKFREEEIFDDTPLPEELSVPLYWKNAETTEQYFLECVMLKAENSIYADIILSGLVKILLGKLKSQQNGIPQEQSKKLAQSVMLYIRQNYDKNLSSEVLANKFGYHPYHMNRMFKTEFGMTIHQAVLKERIRIAKHLLKRTDLTVERITNLIGFADYIAFYQAFRKHTGESPVQYRLRVTSV